MKLTPFAKLFVTVVVLGVLGYAFWHYKGDTVRKWAGAEKGGGAASTSAVESTDFAALKNAPADAERGKGSEGVTGAALKGSGKLGRPLVVGINTWAGHAPGVVFNAGMDPSPASGYTPKSSDDCNTNNNSASVTVTYVDKN